MEDADGESRARRPDVCLAGHISRDIVRIGGGPARTAVGGAVHYAGMAYCRLGLAVTAVTKAGADDAEGLCSELRRAGAEVRCARGGRTTTFEIVYDGATGERSLGVGGIAPPFAAADLAGIRAPWFHLAPLTPQEISPDVIAAARAAAERVILDAQGFARGISPDGAVRSSAWPGMAAALAMVDVLKVDGSEATALTGEPGPEDAARALAAPGPGEVIVTLGAAGAIVRAGGRTHEIAAVTPRRIVDATGAGDSFGAGYVYHRMRSGDVAAAARFAAALAALNLERGGAFAADAAAVDARLRELRGR